MEKNDFNVGDVVQLKSDDLKMMVKEVHDDGFVLCTWHNANLDHKIELYDPRLLRKVDD